MMAEDAFNEPLTQQRGRAVVFVRALHTHHQDVLCVAVQQMRNDEAKGLEVSGVRAKVVSVQPHVSSIIHAGKHQLDKPPPQVWHGGKTVSKPDWTRLISAL